MASFGSAKGAFYPTFVKFHDTFQENLRPILASEEPVFLFGKTKAGKSTLMGRLLSDKTPTEFISWVRNNQLVTRAEAEIVDGVVVGGQGDATTLVPLLRPAGPMNIVDFPGFGDPNETRDIMISLFSKCTLSELQLRGTPPRIVIVVDPCILHQLSDLATQYHMPLRAMFGSEAGYRSFLGNAFFVFTHMDQFAMDPRTAQGMTPQSLIGLQIFSALSTNGSDPLFGQLLGCMGQNHITIDYNTDTRDDCIRKLSEALNRPTNQSGVHSILEATFDVRYNKAVVHMEEDIDLLMQDAAETVEKGTTLLNTQLADYTAKLSEYRQLAEKLKQNGQETSAYRDQQVTCKDQAMIDKQAFEHAVESLECLEESQRAAVGSRDALVKTLTDEKITRVWRNKSHPRTGFTGAPFQFRLDLAKQHQKVRVFMINANEEYEDTDLDSIEPQIRVDLENSPLCNKQLATDGGWIITASCKSQFDIILVDEIRLCVVDAKTGQVKPAPELEKMLKVLQTNIDRVSQIIAKTNADKERFQISFKEHESMLVELQQRLNQAADARVDLRSKLGVCEEAVSRMGEETQKSAEKIAREATTRFVEEKSIQNIQKILDIFAQHRLQSEGICKKFSAYKSMVEGFVSLASQKAKEVPQLKEQSLRNAMTVLRDDPLTCGGGNGGTGFSAPPSPDGRASLSPFFEPQAKAGARGRGRLQPRGS